MIVYVIEYRHVIRYEDKLTGAWLPLEGKLFLKDYDALHERDIVERDCKGWKEYRISCYKRIEFEG